MNSEYEIVDAPEYRVGNRTPWPWATLPIGKAIVVLPEDFLRASMSAYQYGRRHEQRWAANRGSRKIWRVA